MDLENTAIKAASLQHLLANETVARPTVTYTIGLEDDRPLVWKKLVQGLILYEGNLRYGGYLKVL